MQIQSEIEFSKRYLLTPSKSKQAGAQSVAISLKKRTRINENIIRYILITCGVISILTTIGIVLVLGNESLAFFSRWSWNETNTVLAAEIDSMETTISIENTGMPLQADQVLRLNNELILVKSAVNATTFIVERAYDGSLATDHSNATTLFAGERVNIIDFLTNTTWSPQLGEFGILPLLNSTLMTSMIAMVVALPLGLGAAIYMSEYASPRNRAILKPILEILAGIPTVVFGYFALTFMTPLLRTLFGIETVEIFNTASAGIVVGILIIPLVSSIAEDALQAVPQSLRDASYGLGATKLETTIRVVIPAALSGIIAAFIIAVSRAIGETMIVAIAAGAGPNFTANPFESAETMTGHIARISGGDLSYDSIDYNSIFAIGLVLFVFTFVLNVLSRMFTNRFREVYQ